MSDAPQIKTTEIRFMQWGQDLPQADDPNCIYVRRTQDVTPEISPKPRAQSKFERMQSRFPVLQNEKTTADPFLGSKRAFLVAHRVKAQVSRNVQERSEQVQERNRAWNWKREMDQLHTKTKIRDGEALRRQNKIHLKREEPRISTTTGPRPSTRLPRDLQRTQYPRNRLHFFS